MNPVSCPAASTAQGLQHVFLSEQRASSLPPSWNHAHPPIPMRSAVIGAGIMGTGIAATLLAAGLPVALTDPQPAARDRAHDRITRIIQRDIEKGRITPKIAEQRLTALSLTDNIAMAVDGTDIVIEAVFEDLQTKCDVFARLDAATGPDTILASNTSTLDINAIASTVRDPGRVLGMHFFSPAHVMRLVELVRGERTRPEVIQAVLALVQKLGKVGVVAGVCDGFIGNRMFEELLRQAYWLLEEGALPEHIDAAMEAFGFAMGPLRVMDLAGQDIGWSIRKRRAIEQPDRPYSRLPDRICERGRFGQKTGAGFYLYPDGRKAVVDPEITALIVAYSEELGLTRRTIDNDEIVTRCLYALVNEGARILEEGIAWRPSDIDVVWTAGYGFPAARGGPMFHADQIGLGTILDSIEGFARGHGGWSWQPAPLLKQLVSEHHTFGDLNG